MNYLATCAPLRWITPKTILVIESINVFFIVAGWNLSATALIIVYKMSVDVIDVHRHKHLL